MKKSWEQWVALVPWETANSPACPSCGEHAIDYQIFEYKKTGFGYALIWCVACRKGVHISRMVVPANAKVVSFDSRNSKTKPVPPFEITLIH